MCNVVTSVNYNYVLNVIDKFDVHNIHPLMPVTSGMFVKSVKSAICIMDVISVVFLT